MKAIEQVLPAEAGWKEHSNTFSCRAVFYRDDKNGFTVVARNLVGVVSEGETIEEATVNIKEAFAGAIQSYAACQLPIPWGDVIEKYGTKFEVEKHFLVVIDG